MEVGGRTQHGVVICVILLTVLAGVDAFNIQDLLNKIKQSKLSPTESSSPRQPDVPASVYAAPTAGDSARGWYKHAGIAADSQICGQIANDILRRNGSVVDAGIAAQLCNSVVDQPHMGIGGGSTQLVYASPRDGGDKELVYISADNTCPAWIRKNSFNGVGQWSEPYKVIMEDGEKTRIIDYRALTIGIPGEIAGHYTAWERYGRLPWADIVKPSITLARNGYKLTKIVEELISEYISVIQGNPTLTKMYTKTPGVFYSEGDTVTDEKLANTLDKIAQDPLSFYHGQLAQDIIDDVREFGSKLEKSDLENYQPKIMEPIEVSILGGKYKGVVPGAPYGGELFIMAYNIMDGYNMTVEDVSTPEGLALFYHRFIESWKFTHSHVSCIADNAAKLSSKCQRLLKTIMTKEYASKIRGMINDASIQDDAKNYLLMDKEFDVELHGTSHLSIIAEDGSAFLSTSTINTEFGGRFKGTKTGILFNNRLNDFTRMSGRDEEFPEGELNYPGPDRQPMSFRMPLLVLTPGGKPVLAIGASGGSRIMMAILKDVMMHIHFQMDLKQAIDFPRMLHKPISPLYPVLTESLPKAVMDVFCGKGHPSVSPVRPTHPYTAVTQGVSMIACVQCEESSRGEPCADKLCVEAVSDYRKGGAPSGY